MIYDLREVEGEIARLESMPLSHDQCGKLASLYIVRDCNTQQIINPEPLQIVQQSEPQRSVSGDMSEFADLAYMVRFEDLIRIMDRHMDAVGALYPKEYDSIIRKLRDAL